MFLVDLYKTNRASFFLIVWMLAVPLISSSAITFYAIQYEEVIQQFSYYHWIAFFSITCITMAFAFTPTTFIAFFSGYFIAWQATPLMLVAYLIASMLGFYLARHIDNGSFFSTIRSLPKAEKYLEGLNVHQFGIIVLSRISPVLPFAIMNVVLSLLGVRLRDFLWAGFLGMLPRTLLFIWLGGKANALQQLLSSGDSYFQQISFMLLLVLSIVGFYIYFQKIAGRIAQVNTRDPD